MNLFLSLTCSIVLSAGATFLLGGDLSAFIGILILSVLTCVNYYLNRFKTGLDLAGRLMTALVIRFIVGLTFILVMGLLGSQLQMFDGWSIRQFCVQFIIHYVIFTIFEIILFTRLLKRNTQRTP